MIRFKCQACGAGLKVSNAKAGKLAKCPKCRVSTRVPELPDDRAAAKARPAFDEAFQTPDLGGWGTDEPKLPIALRALFRPTLGDPREYIIRATEEVMFIAPQSPGEEIHIPRNRARQYLRVPTVSRKPGPWKLVVAVPGKDTRSFWLEPQEDIEVSVARLRVWQLGQTSIDATATIRKDLARYALGIPTVASIVQLVLTCVAGFYAFAAERLTTGAVLMLLGALFFAIVPMLGLLKQKVWAAWLAAAPFALACIALGAKGLVDGVSGTLSLPTLGIGIGLLAVCAAFFTIYYVGYRQARKARGFPGSYTGVQTQASWLAELQ